MLNLFPSPHMCVDHSDTENPATGLPASTPRSLPSGTPVSVLSPDLPPPILESVPA
jgi:hypothetical protein